MYNAFREYFFHILCCSFMIKLFFPPFTYTSQWQSENWILEMFDNLFNGRNWNVTSVFRFFTEHLVEGTLAVFTASSLLGYDVTSFAHLDFGDFLLFFSADPSSSVRLDGDCVCRNILMSLLGCSVGFKSGLWVGHSRTFKDLSWNHFSIVLPVCLGSLSCWQVNLWLSLRSGPGFH